MQHLDQETQSHTSEPTLYGRTCHQNHQEVNSFTFLEGQHPHKRVEHLETGQIP